MAVAIAVAGPIAARQALPLAAIPSGQAEPGSLAVSSGWRNQSGRILSQDDARSQAPEPRDVMSAQQWIAENFEPVTLVLRGTDAPKAEAFELAGLGSVSAVSIGLAYVVVRRLRVS